MAKELIADFSLGLINRTGAYYICRDIIEECADLFSDVYCWRLNNSYASNDLARKISGRLMMLEYRLLGGGEIFQIKASRNADGARTVFMDPLYVLRSPLTSQDVVLCHDVGPITHSDLFDEGTVALYRGAYNKIQSAAPGIICVSRTTADAFQNIYGDAFRFIEVITLYPRPTPSSLATEKPETVTKPFLLSVGALEKRKNYDRTIAAFYEAGLSDDYELVICGPRGNSAEAVEEAVCDKPEVRLLGRVSDAELGWLYENAHAFVLPSLLEGFGVPVIEAAQQGLVCIVSEKSAQSEAINENAILVDPTDIASIAKGMRRALALSETDKQRFIDGAKNYAAQITRDRFVREWRALLTREIESPSPRPAALQTTAPVQAIYESSS
ncbi:glycosyltransferase family 4 protein [Marinicaulis aureus]|uniref:Glycosyltransferase family 4 protein n=1 Tax=Hyphococcus aureus TaxID=2666033 RepID=A0ABW1KZ36_9PROT